MKATNLSARLMQLARLLLQAARARDDRADLLSMLSAAKALYSLGYLPLDAQDVEAAVALFQERFGLPAHGAVDGRMLALLHRPRCGCPDIARPSNSEHAGYLRLVARVEELRSQWTKRGLRYYVAEYVPGISQADQLEVFKVAWASWTDECLIDVEQTNDPRRADITIGTGRGRRSQFDGPGGTLAWAELPPGNDQPLQMRFDLDETWVLEANRLGVWLLPVAAHEFGHLLGLDHSRVQTALMAPYYNPAVSRPQPIDDVLRVQQLYEPRVRDESPTQKWRTLRVRGEIELDGLRV